MNLSNCILGILNGTMLLANPINKKYYNMDFDLSFYFLYFFKIATWMSETQNDFFGENNVKNLNVKTNLIENRTLSKMIDQ